MQPPEMEFQLPNNSQAIELKALRYYNQRKLLLIVIALCLSPFYYGYSLTYFSSIQRTIKIQTFGDLISRSHVQGLLYGCITIGAAIGALIAPTLMSLFTRKKFVMTINAMAFIVGLALQIPNIWVLFIGRTLQGVFIGNYMAIIPVYFNQLVPLALKGSLGVFTQLFAIVGKVFCYFLGLLLYLTQPGHEFAWRFMFIFTNFVIIIQTALFFTGFIPDTPNSLLLEGDDQEACRVLSMFTRQQYLQEVMAQKRFEVAAAKKGRIKIVRPSQKYLKQVGPKNEPQNKTDGKVQGQVDQKDKDEGEFKPSDSNKGKIQERQEHVKVGWKAYLIGFNLPLMQQMTGANAIIVEAGQIIQIYDQPLSVYTPLIVNSVQLFATLAAAKVIQFMGRRRNILFGNLGIAIMNVFLAIFLILAEEWTFAVTIVFGLLLIYMIIYGVSIGPAVWLYVPEILPPNVVPYATVLNWIGCSFCIIILPIITQACDNNPFAGFLLFAAWSFAAFAVNKKFMIETKGLTTRQVYQKYQ